MDAQRQFRQNITDALKSDKKSIKSVVIPTIYNFIRHKDKLICKLPNGYEVHLPNNYFVSFSMIGDYLMKDIHNFTTNELAIIGYMAVNIKPTSNVIYFNREIICGHKGSDISLRSYYAALETLMIRQVITQTTMNGVYAVNPICIFRGSINSYLSHISDDLKEGIVVRKNKIDRIDFNMACIIKNDNNKTIITKPLKIDG